MAKIVLWGFDGSTYVRTVKMLLQEKGCADYEQVPVNVLEGEPRQPAHLERHPFGKVPVLDYDGFRILETVAIARFLNDELPGKSLVPSSTHDRARMDMAVGLTDSYGYGGLVGVAGYHLFPDFIGGKDEGAKAKAMETGRTYLDYLMKLRGSSPFIAGELSLADLYLAPLLAYVVLTPDKDRMTDIPGLADWWDRISALPSFKDTAPNLG